VQIPPEIEAFYNEGTEIRRLKQGLGRLEFARMQEIETGQHRRPATWRVFTTAYFHHARGLAEELVDAGFEHERTLGIQGPGWLVPDFEQRLDEPHQREILLQIARLTERDPAHSPHMVAVARKPEDPRSRA
jgi:hypothetical protein